MLIFFEKKNEINSNEKREKCLTNVSYLCIVFQSSKTLANGVHSYSLHLKSHLKKEEKKLELNKRS
jgi:hypothetical protein